MSKPTFIEFLTELMVDVDPSDPIAAMKATKQAIKNPNAASKAEVANSVDNQRNIQQSKDDPNKSEKLRIAKMKQQIASNEQRLASKEKQQAARAGVAPEG